MLRPVLSAREGLVELIGPMSQGFMDIAVKRNEIRPGVDSHVEPSRRRC